MSEIIDAAIDVFEKQIQALYTNDFETFLSFMTPHIQKQLTIDIFQKAINLYKQTPIDTDAINRESSKVYNEGESEELPDKHVKLVLVNSGRTLCHVVNINGTWLIDDIYWRVTDLDEQGEAEISESEISPSGESDQDDESGLLEETIETPIDENEIDQSSEEEELVDEELIEEEREEEEVIEKNQEDEEGEESIVEEDQEAEKEEQTDE